MFEHGEVTDMRKIIKAFCLALVFCFVFNSLAYTSIAASAKTFTDESHITSQYRDDVSALVAKNIFSGYPDGSFKPKNKITRAEFSKIIFAFMSCDSEIDINSYQKGISEFKDVEGNANLSWAKGYINFCADKNIVSGVGNSKFNAQGNISVAAATKMILTALGYDQLIEGFMGADWQKNVVAKAREIGLYNDFDGDISAPATREQVCKLINNAFSTYAYAAENLYVETSSEGMKINDINKFCKALEGCWVDLDMAELNYGRYEYLLFEDNTYSRVRVPSEWPPKGKIIEVYKKEDLYGTYKLKIFYEAETRYDQYYPSHTEEVRMFFRGNQILIGRIAPLHYTYICKDYTELADKLEQYK